MLLTNRRHRILYLALAGMELGWILPFAMLLIGYWQSNLAPAFLQETDTVAAAAALSALLTMPPPLVYGIFLATFLLYMLTADILNRFYVESPLREVVMILLLLVTTAVNVRLLLYAHAGLSVAWLGNLGSALFNFTQGRRPEIALVLINAFLWLRVAMSTDRDLSFFGVGLSFRLGLLVAVLGGVLLTTLGGQPAEAALFYFGAFFCCGLAAVTLARMDDKAITADGSRGALLPWSRLMQVLAMVAVTLGLAGLLGVLYTPQRILAFLGLFAPLWRAIGAVLGWLFFGFVWLISPLLERLVVFLRRLLEESGLFDYQPPPQELGEIGQQPAAFNATEFLNNWPVVRYGLTLLVMAVVLAVIWFFFLQTQQRLRTSEGEEAEAERLSYGGGLLQRGMGRLRNWMGLVRRYGLGTQLLAAISIQNIYANVSRLARRRGYPRPPAMPPDLYLPTLEQAFPGCQAELTRITDVYMRVEYGDRTIADADLATLRADYRHVQAAPAPVSQSAQGDTSAYPTGST